jgi:hypothetical protein
MIIGSGWSVNGRPPTNAYLVEQRTAATRYDEAIEEAAKREGVDPALVKSVMLVESNFNPRAVSRKGASGLMQLMPQTASHYGVRDRFDALDCIRGGAKHLSRLLSAYDGDVILALAAYNAGAAAVSRYSGVPPYPETVEYVRRALVAYRGTEVEVVGGTLKRAPRAPSRRSALVEVASLDGNVVLSNVGPTERAAPVLGRVK